MSSGEDSGFSPQTPTSDNLQQNDSCTGDEDCHFWSETTPLNPSAITRNVNLDSSLVSADIPIKTELYAPHRTTTTNCEALMHILKGNIGTGILAIPIALSNSGIVVGTLGLVFVSIVCVHCMHLVLRSSSILIQRTGEEYLGYARTAEMAFFMGPVKYRKFSRTAQVATDVFLCITQLGFCCVYFVFISTNIKEVVYKMSGTSIDYRVYMLGLLIPMICLNMIRNLKHLAPVSTIANLMQIVALGLLFYYIFRDIQPVSTRKKFATWQQLPLWFGTVIYAFEGVGIVLPIKKDMRNPQDLGGWTGVLNTAMTIVACLYIAVGFFGYLSYGDDVLGSITLNLPNEILAHVICILYSGSIFLSYAVQFYVPVQVMWPFIKTRIPITSYHGIAEIVFRIILVLVTFGFAALIPRLDLFISLVGALSGSYLALILPPILELLTHSTDGVSWTMFLKNLCIINVGLIGFLTGTYASIYSIYKSF